MFVQPGSKYFGLDLMIIAAQGRHDKGIDKSINDLRHSTKGGIVTELQYGHQQFKWRKMTKILVISLQVSGRT